MTVRAPQHRHVVVDPRAAADDSHVAGPWTARIPYLDHSRAMPAANVSSAERAIDEWTIIGIPRRGLNHRNAMNPARAGIIQRDATCWVTSHVASRFSRCTARIP